MLRLKISDTEIRCSSDSPHKPGDVSITGNLEDSIRNRLRFAYGYAGHTFSLDEDRAQPIELFFALRNSGFEVEILEGSELTTPNVLPEGAVS